MTRHRVLADVIGRMIQETRCWPPPLGLIFVLTGALIVGAEGSALAPFIYSLFYDCPPCRRGSTGCMPTTTIPPLPPSRTDAS